MLIGHSMGAVMARKVAIVAHGEQLRGDCSTLSAPFETAFSAFVQPRSWASKISRIVLIAGMNRGWTPSSAMDWWTSAKWNFGIWVGETLFAGSPIIFDIRQGAVFSIQTRLQWLALMHYERAQRDRRPSIVVTQLLGTVDDIVSPDDSVDYAVDTSNEEDGDDPDTQSYFYLEVPNSGHADVIQLRRPKDVDAAMKTESFVTAMLPGQSDEDFKQLCDEQRYVVFRRALCSDPASLAADPCTVTRDQMMDSLPRPPNWNVTDLVFVIHGIRDKGFWTQKIARAIKLEAAGRKQDFRSVTTSYGYFAMAPFVLWWVRKQKAEWLMDQYAEARAHYPRAKFSYVGHSNGTYLVARALRDYPAATFKRIVLAGSVVRRDYKWSDLVGKRVEKVLNYVATGDWVVAIFPKGMQPFRLLDLGSAGHDGFDEAKRDVKDVKDDKADEADEADKDDKDDKGVEELEEVTYIAGSHGAGHEERHWADIAKFIVSGDVPKKDAEDQSPVVMALGRCSTGLLVFFVVLILGLGYLIAHPTVGRTLALVVYIWFVYIVISRV